MPANVESARAEPPGAKPAKHSASTPRRATPRRSNRCLSMTHPPWGTPAREARALPNAMTREQIVGLGHRGREQEDSATPSAPLTLGRAVEVRLEV